MCYRVAALEIWADRGGPLVRGIDIICGLKGRMERRRTALFLNNYPMLDALAGWRVGEYPGHHLWGANSLGPYGFDVVVPPYSLMPRLKRFAERYIGPSWGDCDQQLRAFWRHDYDIVYSACQTTTGLLARLRNLGLFHKPLVALLHHELPEDDASRAFVRGHTRVMCLSRKIRTQLTVVFGVPTERIRVLEWGPDLEFYGSALTELNTQEASVVSIGKTRRDHDTLVAAFKDSTTPLTIVGTPPSQLPSSPTIKVVPAYEDSRHVPYREVLGIYRHARIVAIPLIKTGSMAGLTSLLDAMALGKPVIMTRNPWIDIDIEAEGIGLWIAPGDVAGWRRAVRELVSDAGRCRQMGQRARALVETRYNIQNFTAQLANALTDALVGRGV